MTKSFLLALQLVLLHAVGSAQEEPKVVRIFGRAIQLNGSRAVRDVLVQRIEIDGPSDVKSAYTNAQGMFSLLVPTGKTYRVWFGHNFKTPPKTVNAVAGEDIDLGDLVFEYCPIPHYSSPVPPTSILELKGKLKPNQIIIEKQKATVEEGNRIRTYEAVVPRGSWISVFEYPQCWTGPSLDRRADWQQSCTLTFNQYVSVESFVGGKVRAIRVIDHEPHLTAAQIKEEVQRVWFGVFRDATCSIGWSEGNN